MIQTEVQINKCFAAYTLFRELYESDKDIYIILGRFIENVLIEECKYNFVANEIVVLLNAKYGFQIPEAVIKNSLKKISNIKLENHQYYIDIPFKKESFVDDKLLEIKKNNEIIINNLYSYIEEKKKFKLSEQERLVITEAFFSYIIDQDNENIKYKKLISGFILTNEKNEEIQKVLNNAKEGVVLYSALQYTPEEFSTLKWDNKLTLYLDIEIIFSLAGYNGKLSQEIVVDLMNLIKDANRKSNKHNKMNIINLFYFEEIEKEIDNYFFAAEKKIDGSKRLVEMKPAMASILDGCKSKFDIIEKKAKLFKLLKSWDISKDSYSEYYQETNHKYYIGGDLAAEDMQKELSRHTEIEDISYCLTLLSKVNIMRKDKQTNFDNANFHFLTANGFYHECAKIIALKRNHDTFLTVNIDFLTNKLWIKLNKGFSNSNKPKNFDIITKAQIIISNQITNSLLHKYEELIIKFKNKEIDESIAALALVEIRQRNIFPENINESNVNEIISFTEEGISSVIEEQKSQKLKYDVAENQVAKLSEELEYAKCRLSIFESKELKKINLIKNITKIGKGLLLIGIPISVLIISVILIINKQRQIIAISLGVIGLLGTIFGILCFFGFDYKGIKNKIASIGTT